MDNVNDVVAARYRPLDLRSLSGHPRNSKKHPRRQIDALKQSLLAFGWTRPLAEADGVLYFGHGVHEAALELAREGKCPKHWPDRWAAPCIDLSHLEEPERRAYLIADNRLAELGEVDDEMLLMELGSLAEEGIPSDLLGYSEHDMQRLLGEDFEGKAAGDQPGIADVPLEEAFWISVTGPGGLRGEAEAIVSALAALPGIEVHSNLGGAKGEGRGGQA